MRKWGAGFSKTSIMVLTIITFVLCIVTHAFVQSLIIAPIYALITICVISLWRGRIIEILKYIGEHSTNIWLIHMFFYTAIFDGFIFRFKYPIIIFVMMLGLGLVASYVINFLLKEEWNLLAKIKKESSRI